MTNIKNIMIFGLSPLLAVFAGLIIFHNMYITFFLYHFIVCLGIPSGYYLIKNKKTTDLLKYPGLTKAGLICGVITGIASGVTFILVILVCFDRFSTYLIDAKAIKALLSAWKFQEKQLPFLAAYFILFNSIIEELYWRGFLCYEVNKSLGVPASSALVSFFFIQYHTLTIFILFGAEATLIFVPVLFLVSMFWCYTRYYFKNPYTAIISHMAADFSLMAVYLKYVL